MNAARRWRSARSYERETVILVAGASPLLRPCSTTPGDVSVKCRPTSGSVPLATRGAAQAGSRVVVTGGAAALAESPLSEGDASAKATPALHHRLRPGRGTARRAGHRLHRGAPADHAPDRRRPPGGAGPTRPAATSSRRSTCALWASRSRLGSPAPPWSSSSPAATVPRPGHLLTRTALLRGADEDGSVEARADQQPRHVRTASGRSRKIDSGSTGASTRIFMTRNAARP
jgi:hypothetical protein